MKRTKRKIGLLLAGILLISATMHTFATSLDDAQKAKNNLESSVNNANSNINALEAQKSQAEASIAALDEQLNGILANLEALDEQLTSLEEQIVITQEELVTARENEEKQYEDMKKRIKYMYENGNTNFLTILLSSESLADFLNKAEYITKISEYDRDMLTAYEDAKQLVIDKEEQLEAEYSGIENVKIDVQSQRASVENLMSQKTVEIQNYIAEIGAESEKAAAYQKQLDEQQALVNSLKKAQEEQQQKAADAAANAGNSNGGNGGNTGNGNGGNGGNTGNGGNAGNGNGGNGGNIGNGNGGNGGNTGNGNGGGVTTGMTWPIPGCTYITSYFGYREASGVVTAYHNGIDISASIGTPVYAAASGTVTISTLSASAGEYIQINHGNGVYTRYLHLNSRSVSVGATVSQGQLIGYSGNTGNSTGPHLHFDVTVNGGYVNPLLYVSP